MKSIGSENRIKSSTKSNRSHYASTSLLNQFRDSSIFLPGIALDALHAEMECPHHVLQRMLDGTHRLRAFFEPAFHVQEGLLLRLAAG